MPLGSGAAGSNAVAVADLDGDGLPDLIFANDGANAVYRSDGAGGFQAEALKGSSRSVAVVAADLLGDPLPELVFANVQDGAVLYANTAGMFGDPVTIDGAATVAAAAADFDGDSVRDLVLAQRQGANPVYLNNSAPTPSFFAAARLGGVQTVAVLTGDFDGDGRNNVVTINEAGAHELYTNGGAPNTVFRLQPTQFQSAGAVAAVAAHFNADERLDVAVAGGDRIEVFFNDGRATLGLGDRDAPTLTLKGDPIVTVTVGDTYADAGATASDPEDGDLTNRITVDNPVDPNVIGTYPVSYNVVDESGNAARTLTRSVEVKARVASGGGGGGGGIGAADLLLLVPAALSFEWRRQRRSRLISGARR